MYIYWRMPYIISMIYLDMDEDLFTDKLTIVIHLLRVKKKLEAWVHRVYGPYPL